MVRVVLRCGIVLSVTISLVRHSRLLMFILKVKVRWFRLPRASGREGQLLQSLEGWQGVLYSRSPPGTGAATPAEPGPGAGMPPDGGAERR